MTRVLCFGANFVKSFSKIFSMQFIIAYCVCSLNLSLSALTFIISFRHFPLNGLFNNLLFTSSSILLLMNNKYLTTYLLNPTSSWLKRLLFPVYWIINKYQFHHIIKIQIQYKVFHQNHFLESDICTFNNLPSTSSSILLVMNNKNFATYLLNPTG